MKLKQKMVTKPLAGLVAWSTGAPASPNHVKSIISLAVKGVISLKFTNSHWDLGFAAQRFPNKSKSPVELLTGL